MPTTELEWKVFLICLVLTSLAYASGWVISRWYNNYPERGKHIGNRFRRKKG